MQTPSPGSHWTLDRRAWLRQTTTTLGLAACAGFTGTAARQPEAPSSAPVRLHTNENPYGPPPAAREAARLALADANRYVSAQLPPEALVDLIAARERVPSDHVVLGHGSWELLGRIAAAWSGPGRDVVAAEPTFFGLPDAAARAGARVVRVPLDGEERHDLAAMARALSARTAIAYVCNPNNPTGTLVPAPHVARFVEHLPADAMAVVDEAYHEYVDAPEYASAVALVRQGARVVVTRSFSKIYGLAGLRLGYALAPAALADRLRAANPGPMSVAGVAAAAAALTDGPFVERSRALNREARARFLAAVRAAGLEAPDAHANFVFVRLGPRAPEIQQALAREGLLIWPPTAPRLEQARVTIGTAEQMARLAARIAALHARGDSA